MATLRAMELGDVRKVVRIIDAYDDDDAESAEEDYEHSGLDNQFVLEVDDKVIGVTGYRAVEGADNTYWLSWTYLDKSKRGNGLGKSMLTQLLDKLRAVNARKIFVKISDYEDPKEGKIYEIAHKLYESVGFKHEVTDNDYYDDSENLHILGLAFDTDATEPDYEIEEEKPIIRFDKLFEIAETEGSYSFSWVVEEKKLLFNKRSFTVLDLKIGIDSVKQQGGRKIFLTFPSNLPLIHKPLQTAGFKLAGQLTDYYEQGVHELHFTHDLSENDQQERQ